jgi:uncharacterized protein with PQ loop repeat
MHPGSVRSDSFNRILYALSILTMVMTIPQVVSIWLNRSATGVSVLTWSTYLVSACVWLIHGIRRRDPNIYLPCIGWIVLDAVIVIGVVRFG